MSESPRSRGRICYSRPASLLENGTRRSLSLLSLTQKEVRHLSEPAPKPKRNVFAQVVWDVFASFTNRSFRWLFFGVLVVYVMAGVNGALDLYMFQYFWELTGREMMWLNMGTVLGLLCGVFLVVPILRYAGKRTGVLGTAGHTRTS